MNLMSLTAVELGKKIKSGEVRVVDAVNEQAQKLMDNDKDYQAAVYVGNLNAAGSIGNVLQAKAEEMVYQTIVYV